VLSGKNKVSIAPCPRCSVFFLISLGSFLSFDPKPIWQFPLQPYQDKPVHKGNLAEAEVPKALALALKMGT
jgi:hypothetical protein